MNEMVQKVVSAIKASIAADSAEVYFADYGDDRCTIDGQVDMAALANAAIAAIRDAVTESLQKRQSIYAERERRNDPVKEPTLNWFDVSRYTREAFDIAIEEIGAALVATGVEEK